MKIYRITQVFLLVFLVHDITLSQDSIPKRIYETTFVGDMAPPKIDGILDDEVWKLVEWNGDYVEWSPEENTTPIEKTQMKILYDEKSLYVAFRCFDSDPEGIVKRLSRRDGFDGDWIEINIDSFHDLRTAFSFTTSVSGVKGDEFISNDGATWDNTWNPIWYTKTNIDKEGWTAEIRIPLSQLRFSKSENQVWGIQSTRRYFRDEERSVWQRSPINAPGWVSSFGELHGLSELRPQKQLEIQPYVVSSLTKYETEGNNPFRDGSDFKLNAGLDGKIGVTNDLTVDFTINPDFGQVEADPSAIALDGFQIFFPEQRPFFIENKNIYDYPISLTKAFLSTGGIDNLFYSRRIGRSPQGFANINNNEFSDQPSVSTILGATKFSGKTRDGWSIGVLESVTAEEVANISDGTNESDVVVEPLTNYFVTRVQKDFNNNNTFVGGIFTAVNRNLSENVDFLHQSAYTGGFDVTHQWKNRAYYFKGNLAFSSINGNERAITATQQSITHLFQRDDAGHVAVDTTKTNLTGSGGAAMLGKASGNWRFETGGTWRSPELELNDVGFQLTADDIKHFTWVQYRTTMPKEEVRSYAINYTHVSTHDFQGNFNDLSFRFNGWVNLNNNWWINGGSILSPRRYSNSALRGGPRLRRQPWFDYQVGLISDSRKKLRFNINFRDLYDIGASNHYQEINTTLTYQPTNALQVSLAPFYSKNVKQLQYVNTSDFENSRRYINGTISQQTLQFPLRIDYTITPNLSVQYWGQPFISRGTYKDFKYIFDANAKNFEDRFSLYQEPQIALVDGAYEIDENFDGTSDYSFFNPDFSSVQWRSNLVLRWEYIPGSELYLVWSQDISQFGDVNDGLFDGLNNNILNKKPENIFLIKATYRFAK